MKAISFKVKLILVLCVSFQLRAQPYRSVSPAATIGWNDDYTLKNMIYNKNKQMTCVML